MKKVIVISGPTACGKTKTSLKLAYKLLEKFKRPISIVNFDSLLFYKELNIGTAKPDLSERGSIPHHLIDVRSINNPMNASQFIIEAKKTISHLHKKGTIPILVGGSGFYLRALIKGMYQCLSPSEQIKQDNKELFETEGIAPFLTKLKEIDPKSYSYLHPNDCYRIMRAIEFYQATNKPISEEKERLDSQDPYDFSKSSNLDWDIFHNYLDLPKEDHKLIIEKRTQKMIKDGLLEEVESLLQKGFSGEEKPLLSIGYKETVKYLQGKFKDKKEYIERINISTRQLAKAQRTFFNKVKHKKNFNPLDDIDHLINQITQFIQE